MIPTITSTNLNLRPFTADDAEAMFRILSGPEVLKYFPGSSAPTREGAARLVGKMIGHWETYGYGLWAVESKATGALLGRCGLQHLPDTDEVEVDFIIGREYWGQGVATEAGLASLNYGFDTLGVATIVGIVHRKNKASQRVLEKLGMALTGEAEYFGLAVYRYARARDEVMPAQDG